MKTISLTEAKDQLSAFVKQARKEDVVITVHGRAVAVLQGFEDDDDFFEYRLLNDPRFKGRVARARQQFREGKVTRLEDIED